jgi:hypothetical protein
MPVPIISASGTQYGMVVNPDGSINVSGIDISIGSLALSLENVYVQSGDNISITSMPLTQVYGSGIFIGSITSMPGITTGSEIYIKGGSISVYNMVAGSIVYMPNINVTVGSESWIKGGSIEIYNLYAGSESWIKNLGSQSYIAGGSVIIKETSPIDTSKNNPAYKLEYTAQNNVGSITMFIGTGSYVQILTWQGGSVLTNVGSYF